MKRDCEELIRTGRIDLARNLLIKIKKADFPRDMAIDFANFARRTGLASIGLLILDPIINPKVVGMKAASPAEKTVYAGLLVKLGLIEEALRILTDVQDLHPDAALYMASAHMHEWNYTAAVPHLKRFINQAEITPYQRAIGQVNLAASLISCDRYSESSRLLKSLLVQTTEQNWTLLHRNALELSAQIAIQKREWDQARELVAGASGEDSKNAVASLYVEKVSAVIDLEREGANDRTLQALTKVRGHAHELKDWETIRDCDFRSAMAAKDKALLMRVYFGTPHRSFRKRIQRLTKDWCKIPDTFDLVFEGGGERRLDLQTGIESGPNASPDRLSGTLLALLQTLASDSYRPQSIASLFGHVFRGENFNPISSPNRTAQGIFRLRQWLFDRNIPMQIAIHGGECRLMSTGPYTLVTRAKFEISVDKKDESYLLAITNLKSRAPYKAFSSQQAAEWLSISSASAKRLLKWAGENDKVIRVGDGRATLYRFAA